MIEVGSVASAYRDGIVDTGRRVPARQAQFGLGEALLSPRQEGALREALRGIPGRAVLEALGPSYPLGSGSAPAESAGPDRTSSSSTTPSEAAVGTDRTRDGKSRNRLRPARALRYSP